MLLPEEMKLDILYEDNDVLVVNKPKRNGRSSCSGHMTGTLVNGLLAHCQDLSGINGVCVQVLFTALIKILLDLLMVAKNDMAHRKLVEQLLIQSMTRKYVALVHGVIPHDYGTIDAPIAQR